MLKKAFILIIVSSIFLSACRQALPGKSTESYAAAVRAFYVGLAALQVGDDQRAQEELTKAAQVAEGEPAVWNNLGVLRLRQKDYDASLQSFEKAQNLSPANALIISNLALVEIQRGNFDRAIAHLEKSIELAPDNLRAVYALAQEKERQTKDAEALEIYERIAQKKPENLAIKLEIARLSAKLGQTAKLQQAIDEIGKTAANFPPDAKEQFRALQAAANDPRRAAAQISFLKNLLVREPAFRSGLAEIKPSETALGEVFLKPLKLPAPDFAPAEADTNLTFAAQTAENVNANFAKAIFLNGDAPAVVAWSNDAETRVGKISLPVAVRYPDQITAFDFDFDFKNDLAIATEKGFRLFRQTDGENFEDVTANAKIPNETLQKSYAGVWTFDAESDGDLDLILASETGAPVVLQNNSDGTFAEIKILSEAQNLRDFAWFDADEDGDGDIIVLNQDQHIVFFLNERGGLFKKQIELNKSVEMSSSFSAGDLNNDGQMDFVAASSRSLPTTITRISPGNSFDGNFESNPVMDAPRNFCWEIESEKETRLENGVPSTITTTIDHKCSLKVADFDNNGASDILLGNINEARIFLAGADGKFLAEGIRIAGRITSVAEINGDGKLDLIGVDADGKPTVFQNQSQKNYHWQILRPRASKTEGDQRVNSFGIGGELEIRAGLAAQKRVIDAPQVHFGLGEQASADVLRVVWGNGYVQAEFDLKSDQSVLAEQRLKGSCPHLFAWNGEKFALVKDAPPWSPALGLKINAQETYGILQTEEWFKIPGESLKPKDGFYELRITGEYWESFYLDNYRLIAVDHPAQTEVFTDERFAIPLPPLKVFTTERRRELASVTNHKGETVAEIVRDLDENYLDDFRRGAFQGVAEDHFVEFELPADAPTDKKIRLVADGFIHPTDASINVQLGQSSRPKPKSLSLEIQTRKGEWKPARENLGFPAGKMKTVLIDLPPGARKFRLRTNMEIFWDRLAWAVDPPENQTLEQALAPSQAELRYRGFSVIEKRDDSSPEKPVYERVLTTAQRWRDLEGFYTRFGDVLELLLDTDDRMVLMNAGDELVLKFPALPAPPDGWTRDFVIVGNGWIKDGDLNSVFSKTLLPLPTHETNDYTRAPTRLEDDPVYQKNRRDWLNFHTRYVAPDNFRKALRTK